MKRNTAMNVENVSTFMMYIVINVVDALMNMSICTSKNITNALTLDIMIGMVKEFSKTSLVSSYFHVSIPIVFQRDCFGHLLPKKNDRNFYLSFAMLYLKPFPIENLEPINTKTIDHLYTSRENLTETDKPTVVFYKLGEKNEQLVKDYLKENSIEYHKCSIMVYAVYKIPENASYELKRHVDDKVHVNFSDTVLISIKTNDDDELYVEGIKRTRPHDPCVFDGVNREHWGFFHHDREIIIVSNVNLIKGDSCDVQYPNPSPIVGNAIA